MQPAEPHRERRHGTGAGVVGEAVRARAVHHQQVVRRRAEALQVCRPQRSRPRATVIPTPLPIAVRVAVAPWV